MEGGRGDDGSVGEAGRPPRPASRPGEASRAPSTIRPTRSPCGEARARGWRRGRATAGAGSSRSTRSVPSERRRPARVDRVGRPVVDDDHLVVVGRRCPTWRRGLRDRRVRGSSRAMSWATTTTLNVPGLSPTSFTSRKVVAADPRAETDSRSVRAHPDRLALVTVRLGVTGARVVVAPSGRRGASDPAAASTMIPRSAGEW